MRVQLAHKRKVSEATATELKAVVASDEQGSICPFLQVQHSNHKHEQNRIPLPTNNLKFIKIEVVVRSQLSVKKVYTTHLLNLVDFYNMIMSIHRKQLSQSSFKKVIMGLVRMHSG